LHDLRNRLGRSVECGQEIFELIDGHPGDVDLASKDVVGLLEGSALDESRDGLVPGNRGRTDPSPVGRTDAGLDAL
jgi:hypothetical protein